MAAELPPTPRRAVPPTSRAGALHALVATVAIAGLILQVILVSRGIGTAAGLALAPRLLRLFSFFTVESNVLVAVSALLLAFDPGRDGPAFRVGRLMGLVGITVTGVVYSSVLAGLVHFTGWEKVADTLFHYVVPVLAVLAWLYLGPRPRVDRRSLLLAMLFPVAWIGWTLVHGEFSDWYPYPFVDVTSHGYARVALNCVLVALLMAAVAGLFLVLDRRLPPASSNRSAPASPWPSGR